MSSDLDVMLIFIDLTRQSVACNARRHPVLDHQNTYAKSQTWSKHCLDIGHQCYLAVLRDK